MSYKNSKIQLNGIEVNERIEIINFTGVNITDDGNHKVTVVVDISHNDFLDINDLANDGSVSINTTGTSTNINLVLNPNGMGLVIAPNLYDMSSGPPKSFVTKDYVDSNIIGGLHHMTFLDHSSDVREQWLGYYDDGISSSDIFGIMPWKSKLVGLTFSNKKTGVDQTVRIYSTPEGGGISPKTLDFSWVLTNIRTARKTNFPVDIIFDAGDKIGIFLKDFGTNADKPVVKLYFQIIDSIVGEGSENTSGSYATGTGGGSS